MIESRFNEIFLHNHVVPLNWALIFYPSLCDNTEIDNEVKSFYLDALR